MYTVDEFLQGAMKNCQIVFVDKNGHREFFSINEIGNKYDDKTFTCWDVIDGILYLFLD